MIFKPKQLVLGVLLLTIDHGVMHCNSSQILTTFTSKGGKNNEKQRCSWCCWTTWIGFEKLKLINVCIKYHSVACIRFLFSMNYQHFAKTGIIYLRYSPVWGMRVENPSAWATVISVFSTIQGKTMAKSYQALLLRSYAITKITAHAPGQHMWPSPGPWPDPKCTKTVEELNPCQCEVATDEIQKTKYRAAINNARVSAPTGSVPRKMAEGQHRVEAPCRNLTHIAQLTASRLNH